ncbi:hypothetical protein CORC01_06380 [Colletotrichum orchidophilum]|uniref:Uncharacterized protein n=1 Tax=Colletotrichum orchidophilum TaxID=1209926 RepID=A0A1G4BAF5_9PEZI|nr:uncharacterized protein CORC01_06380 [Colletotrichum orchidophilum]OHE98384.1 hypothetical protein CORC01_06380 [Colletotrichum orchidophilum]
MDRTHRCQAHGTRRRIISNCCQWHASQTGSDRPSATIGISQTALSGRSDSTNRRRNQSAHRTTLVEGLLVV